MNVQIGLWVYLDYYKTYVTYVNRYRGFRLNCNSNYLEMVNILHLKLTVNPKSSIARCFGYEFQHKLKHTHTHNYVHMCIIYPQHPGTIYYIFFRTIQIKEKRKFL